MVGACTHTEETLAAFCRILAKNLAACVLNSCTSLSHIYLGARAPHSILCYIYIFRPLAVAFFGCMPSP
jgi:hypothetical protein